MIELYTAIVAVTLLFLMITAADAVSNRLIKKSTKIKVAITCLLIAGSAVSECIGVLTNGAPASFLLLHKIAKLVEFCAAPAIGVSAAIAYGKAKKPKLAVALVVAHALFECVALPFGWVFRVDAQNLYHRQKLYAVYIVAFLLSIGYVIASIIRHGKAYQVGVDSVLICTLVMLVVGIGIQFFHSGIRIDYLCIAMANLLFYIRYYKIKLQLDSLTRLLNRRCYDVHLANLGSRAVILLFDVDRFKEVNDTYGHAVGDLCLKTIAQELRNVYSRSGQCFRIGGDEFCVILQDGAEQVEELNQRFQSAVRYRQAEDSRMPGVSIGYAYYDSGVSHIQDVIEEADAMLYENKPYRKNRHPANKAES